MRRVVAVVTFLVILTWVAMMLVGFVLWRGTTSVPEKQVLIEKGGMRDEGGRL